MPPFLTTALLAITLLAIPSLACRLTAGPPPRPTSSPRAPIPSQLAGVPGALSNPTRAPRITPAGPTQTPVLPPSPSPSPTLLARLPDDLPRLRPRELSGFRPLFRLESGQDQPFTAMAVSSDGKYLAAVDCSQGLHLWDFAGSEPLEVQAVEAPAACQGSWPVVFSPADRLLVSARHPSEKSERQAGLQIWTVSPYFGVNPAQALSATLKTVTSLAFSPDGRLLVAGTTENQAKLWFMEDPIEPGAGLTELGLLPHGDWVTSVAISPDGRWLASASAEPPGASGTPSSGETPAPAFAPVIHLWRISELLLKTIAEVKPRASLRLPAGPIHQLAFSPDSRFLAAAGEGVSIWQINRRARVAELEGMADSLAFSPDGALLASGGEQGLVLWDFRAVLQGERQPLSAFAPPGGEILQLAFHPAGSSLAVLTADGSLWLWGVAP